MILFSSCLILFLFSPSGPATTADNRSFRGTTPSRELADKCVTKWSACETAKAKNLESLWPSRCSSSFTRPEQFKRNQARPTPTSATTLFLPCVSIYDKLLTDAQCDAILDEMERQYHHGSCLNSVAKLKVILDKTDCLESRRFVLAALLDYIQSGQLTNEQAWGGWIFNNF